MITRERRKEYIKAGGSFCINCGSGDISAGRIESEGREAWQPVVCKDCGSEWNDIFRLIGVDEVILNGNDSMDPRLCGNKLHCAKPLKSHGKWRKEAFTGARLLQYCLKLFVAARQVIRNWESGDLAAAVRNLECVIKEIEAKFRRTGRLRSKFTLRKRTAGNPMKS
jgi:hypothetical protein